MLNENYFFREKYIVVLKIVRLNKLPNINSKLSFNS